MRSTKSVSTRPARTKSMLWTLLLGAVACVDMPAGQIWGRLTRFPSGSKTIQRGSPDQGYALAAWDAHAHNPRPRRGFSPFPGGGSAFGESEPAVRVLIRRKLP